MGFLDTLKALSDAHRSLKRRIHAFRLPVRSRAGLAALSVFYFTAPCVAGVFIMRWTNDIRDAQGPHDERLLAAKARWRVEDGLTPATTRSGTGRA